MGLTSGECNELAQRAIVSDAAFVAAVARRRQAPTAAVRSFMSLVPYLSLFLYETRRTEVALGKPPPPLRPDEESVLAASRHSLKLFEDRKRGVVGQVKVMREEVIPAHRKRFLGNTWLPLARRFESDLGIYRVDREVFSTTHALTHLMGFPPEAVEDTKTLGQFMHRTGMTYGRSFATRCPAEVAGERPKLLEDARFDSICDRRSEKVYPEIFNGSASPDLNAFLTTLLTLVQFATQGFTPGTEDFAYTTFKIRFITAYQLTSSLRGLAEDGAVALTEPSRAQLKSMTQTADAEELLGPAGRWLRNTLVHYRPGQPKRAVSIGARADLTHALITLSGTLHAADDYIALIDRTMRALRNGLLAWCGVIR